MQTEQFQLHAEIEYNHWWFVARRRIMRRLVLCVLPPQSETMVIDIGCGTGANVAALSADYACLGIDTSPEAIALARQRFPRVKFFVGRAPEALGELVKEARLFLLMDVLEHVADDFAMLSQLLAAAAPEALFFITVPAGEALWSVHDESFGHCRRYDPRRLERLWADLPVRTRLMSYFSARTYPIVRLVRFWNRIRHRSVGRCGTDFWLPAAPLNRLLTAFFVGEGRRLEQVLLGRKRGYRAGSSLVAIVERQDGPLMPRTRPPDVAPDRHCPKENNPFCLFSLNQPTSADTLTCQ